MAMTTWLYLGFNDVMAAAVSVCLDTFNVRVNGLHLLYAFEETQYIIETHHNNCNHQSSDTDQINLIWEQFVDPAVAILQRKNHQNIIL